MPFLSVYFYKFSYGGKERELGMLINDIIFYLYIFFVSACIGSFINVVIDRIISKKKMTMTERSHCCDCGHVLSFLDLIPIISYILLRGKCRYCKAKFGIDYLLVEILFAIIGLFLFFYYGLTSEFLLKYILFVLLYIVFQVDLKTMEIPISCNIGILVLAILNCIVFNNISFLDMVLGAFSVSTLLFIVYKLIPGSFGGGDIKLFFTSGAFLGLGNILVAFILSLIFCLIYIIIKRSKKNTQIAFGPYISLGVFISSIWGSVIMLNYLQLFGM